MQLAGNPSLVDPRRLEATIEMVAKKQKSERQLDGSELAELMKLPEQERQAAIDQAICPVTMLSLGSMGVPLKVEVDGKAIYVCCESCSEKLLKSPATYLAKLNSASAQKATESASDPGLPPMGEIMEIEP